MRGWRRRRRRQERGGRGGHRGYIKWDLAWRRSGVNKKIIIINPVQFKKFCIGYPKLFQIRRSPKLGWEAHGRVLHNKLTIHTCHQNSLHATRVKLFLIWSRQIKFNFFRNILRTFIAHCFWKFYFCRHEI